MPIFKFIMIAGLALLGIILSAEAVIGTSTTAPQTAESTQDTYTSGALAGLRAMAHHGESKRVAAAAAAGPFLPVGPPAVVAEAAPATSEFRVTEAVKPAAEPAPQPSLMDAQAQVVSDPPKPVKKKVAARKAKPRNGSAYAAAPFQSDRRYGERRTYVQNSGFDFFGAIQSW